MPGRRAEDEADHRHVAGEVREREQIVRSAPAAGIGQPVARPVEHKDERKTLLSASSQMR